MTFPVGPMIVPNATVRMTLVRTKCLLGSRILLHEHTIVGIVHVRDFFLTTLYFERYLLHNKKGVPK